MQRAFDDAPFEHQVAAGGRMDDPRPPAVGPGDLDRRRRRRAQAKEQQPLAGRLVAALGTMPVPAAV
ncbi:MAG TPA: hypothetical protein VGG06_24210 [Thermoanaerobaculia bacterium]